MKIAVCVCVGQMYLVDTSSCVSTAIVIKNETLHSNIGSCDNARNSRPHSL